MQNSTTMVKHSALRAVLLVLITVMLGLASAFILKEAALNQDLTAVHLILIFGIVAAVNGIRFIVWGYIHRRYPLGFSYPITSMFFPLILVMGYFYGEPITLMKLFGVVLIASGTAVLAYENSDP